MVNVKYAYSTDSPDDANYTVVPDWQNSKWPCVNLFAQNAINHVVLK